MQTLVSDMRERAGLNPVVHKPASRGDFKIEACVGTTCRYLLVMFWLSGSLCLPLMQVFLFSALCNARDVYSEPYPAAKSPGEAPVSMQDFNAGRKRAQAALIPRQGQIEVSSGSVRESGCRNLRFGRTYQAAPVPFGELHLTTRLAPSVFLGRCDLPPKVLSFR